MLFHEKLDIKLMRLVKENPVLYDFNNVKYMDFNAREVAWQKIGDELKRPAAVCKIRWINIRDVYRRILRKNNEPGQRPKIYKYENEVSFLRPFYKDVATPNDDFESDDRASVMMDDFVNDQPGIESDNSDGPIHKLKIKKAGKSSTKKKKKKQKFSEIEDPLPTSVFNESTAPSEFDSSDPVDAFLLSIGATLKTFSPYHLNLAKTKIFSVVQEHDLQQIVQKEQDNENTSHDVKVSTTDSLYNIQ